MLFEHDLNEFNEVVNVLEENNVNVCTRVFDELVPSDVKRRGYKGVCIGVYEDEPVLIVFYRYGSWYAVAMDCNYNKEVTRTCITCGKFKEVSDDTFNIKDGATIPSCRECGREYPYKHLNASFEKIHEDVVRVPLDEYRCLKAIQESQEELLNRINELVLFVAKVNSLTEIIRK